MFTEDFLKKFKKFLKENLKKEFQNFNLSIYLEDLEFSQNETGSNSYELTGFETKSGNPECFNYSTSTRYFNENSEEIFEETEIENAAYYEKTFL